VKPGQVINDAATGYRALVLYLGPLSLAANVAVVLLSILQIAVLGSAGFISALIVSLVANFWILGLLVQTTDDLMEDEGDPWIAARFKRFWPFVNRVSVAALLMGLVLVPGYVALGTGHPLIGLVLLLVGVVALTFCVLVVPLIVIEDWSVADAFARSRELVAGNALRVFATLFMAGLLAGIANTAVQRIVLAVTDSLYGAVIVSMIVEALFVTPFLALVVVSIYYAIRDSVGAAAPVSA
jgi:hypothetical protein